MPEPRVFSIPPGVSFLDTLADTLLDGTLVPGFRPGDDPAALAGATIYLPTRRAGRALAAVLADRFAGRPLLLPRIVPLGEADDGIDLAAPPAEGPEAGAIPPPIGELERTLILTRLIQRWSAQVDRALLRLSPDTPFLVPSSPADAVLLAGDLEALMDSLATEGVSWDSLSRAVSADYSAYFEITLRFVRIAAESWPAILAERGASDPTKRRDALLLAAARRLGEGHATGPVIAAGSTGSIPATAALLAAVARLPNGAVVLPGLDRSLDEASFALLSGDQAAHGHPQAVLHALLTTHLGIGREGVRDLGAPDPRARARARVLSEALRPADSTDRWAAMPAPERAALVAEGTDGLVLVDAADEREEALAIAVALRETLETPGRTAVLVTPDRALAKRVAAELGRWGVRIEDSAGVSLADTEAGRLARLAAEAAAHGFEPVRLISLLAHPAVRLGLSRADLERGAAALEIGVLRGARIEGGLAGLAAAVARERTEREKPTEDRERQSRPKARLTRRDLALAARLVEALEEAFAGFGPTVDAGGPVDLAALAARHAAVVEALAASGPGPDEAPFQDGSHEALCGLFDDLGVSGSGGVSGRFRDYPAFFAALARGRPLSPPVRRAHPRLKILGILEARLLHADRVVVGGLDEGVWPPRAETDAFLNRPMRAEIGLLPPERRIGQTAHDFVQALGVRDAIVTRAAKRDGSPTVPSRFLQRIRAFCGDDAWAAMAGRGRRILALARALDAPRPTPPLRRPEPRPDPALFPRSLSVTAVETLVRDPYQIFARHVLKLDALDPLDSAPGAADRGSLIHAVLAAFTRCWPDALPANPLGEVLALGRDAFAEIRRTDPELYAQWWPRFERLAAAFIDWERERRGGIGAIAVETRGSLDIPLSNGETFTLRGRADRIETGRDGRAVIIDYKTGDPPGVAEVFCGFAPQLTLEAAMLMRGAFAEVAAPAQTPDLLYLQATGGRDPLKSRPVEPGPGEERSVAAIVEEHFTRLQGLLTRFMAGEAAYVSRPYPKYAKTYSDYDHLARVKEWSAAGGADEVSA